MHFWLKTKTSISENAQGKSYSMKVDKNETFGVSKGALQMGQVIILSKQLDTFWNLGITRTLN